MRNFHPKALALTWTPAGWIALLLLAACRGAIAPAVEEIPPLVTELPPLSAHMTLEALTSASAPARDLLELGRRYRNLGDLPLVATKEPANLIEGDSETFWYKDRETNENVQVNAILVYRSDELNFWLEEGEKVSQERLFEATSFIEEQILPTNRAFFGQEWQPGIDGDARVNLLHLREIGGNTVGYFSQADEYTSAINPFSNEREILYLDLKNAPIGSEDYYHVVAHEMQHMIHWSADPNEEVWLDEGMAELAAHLNGSPGTGFLEGYGALPDVQLTDFVYEGPVVRAHYGAAYLFSLYFLDRFGIEATRDLVGLPLSGIAGIEQSLAALDTNMTFDDLFADWLVANYLDGRGLGRGAYQYRDFDGPQLAPENSLQQFPSEGGGAVHQYGADFIRLRSDEPLTVVFTGTQQSRLIDAVPHSGEFLWSTLPADDSSMVLMRELDLSGVERATLTFWTWYELEEGWDYAYVSVSADRGTSWKLLETASSTQENPQGNAFGPGYTGVSGGGDTPIWIQESADLTPYAGSRILLRFETVTDDTVHFQGFALDDIAVEEIGFRDDGESGDGGWEAAGFVRHANILPQSFLLQLILLDDGVAEVRRLALDENRQGRWTAPMNSELNEAVLVVSGTTPVTRQIAPYSYRVEPAPR